MAGGGQLTKVKLNHSEFMFIYIVFKVFTKGKLQHLLITLYMLIFVFGCWENMTSEKNGMISFLCVSYQSRLSVYGKQSIRPPLPRSCSIPSLNIN